MREQELPGLLAMARARVRDARTLLARPRSCNLDECVTLFREAQGYLEWLRDSLIHLPPAQAGLRGEAAALAGEIRQAGVLLDRAARLGSRWLAGWRPVAPEYTPSGRAKPLHLSGHVSFLG